MPNASRPVAVYDYRDEQNHLLYQVCRFKPKRFLRRRPHPELPGEWDYHTAGVRSVLYRLPELLARPEEVVFFVEGEKDADGLLARGYLATTAAGGANILTRGVGSTQKNLCQRWCGSVVKPPAGRSSSSGRPPRRRSTSEPSAKRPRP